MLVKALVLVLAQAPAFVLAPVLASALAQALAYADAGIDAGVGAGADAVDDRVKGGQDLSASVLCWYLLPMCCINFVE